MGNFTKNPVSFSTAATTGMENTFQNFADVLKEFPRLCHECRWIFIPGPHDPGFSAVLPRPPLPSSLTNPLAKQLRNVTFTTNPCRLKIYTQEVFLYREDLLKRILRHCVLQNISPKGNFLPYMDVDSQYTANQSMEVLSIDNSEDDNESCIEKDINEESDKDSDLDSIEKELADMEAALYKHKQKKSTTSSNQKKKKTGKSTKKKEGRDKKTNQNTNKKANNKDAQQMNLVSQANISESLVSTILHQAHVSPLPLRAKPIYWNFDHSLRLYPLPDIVIQADSADGYNLMNSGTRVANPGSFFRTFEFHCYTPCDRSYEVCSLDDKDN